MAVQALIDAQDGSGFEFLYLTVHCLRCGAAIEGKDFIDVVMPGSGLARVCPGCKTKLDQPVIYEEAIRNLQAVEKFYGSDARIE